MSNRPEENNTIIHRVEERCFLGVEGGLLTYEMDSQGRFVVLHTEVPENLRGRGIAARLTEAALAFAEQNGYVVVPQCEYVAAYMKRRSKEFTTRT